MLLDISKEGMLKADKSFLSHVMLWIVTDSTTFASCPVVSTFSVLGSSSIFWNFYKWRAMAKQKINFKFIVIINQNKSSKWI